MKVRLEDVCDRGSSNLKQSDIVDTSGNYPIYGASGYISNVDFYHQDKPYVAVVKDGAGIGRTTLHPAQSSVIGTMQYLIPKENILPEYLYYVVRYMHLEKYFTGATIPHIYFKDYKNEQFNLDSLEKQKEIIDILGNCERVITKREEELQKLDKLIKARFVELFGDPLNNTKGWMEQRLGECCVINPKKTTDSRLEEDLEISFIPMASVSECGEILKLEDKFYREVKNGFTYFCEGDVLFAKITPCMENGKGAVAVGLTNGIGFGSTEFHVLRPIKEKSNSYWLYALTSFELFRKKAEKNMTGSAGQKRVPASFLENIKISVPPISLQDEFEKLLIEVNKSKVEVKKALDEAQLLFDSLMQKYFG